MEPGPRLNSKFNSNVEQKNINVSVKIFQLFIWFPTEKIKNLKFQFTFPINHQQWSKYSGVVCNMYIWPMQPNSCDHYMAGI